MPRASAAAPAGTPECSAARLVRFLRVELRARGELERPLTVLAFGAPLVEIARELRAAGLERSELVAAQGSWHEREPARDLADGAFRRMLPRVDVLLLDGVLERLADPVAALRELADRARYLVFSYDPPAASTRASAGCLSEIELRILARSLGVELACERPGEAARERLPVFLVRTVAAARRAA